MRLLEEKFTGRGEVKGFRFTRLKQNQQAFLYKVENSTTVWYEVFERKVNKQFDCESYPRSKSFGLWAWTTSSLERALDLFTETTNRVLDREVING